MRLPSNLPQAIERLTGTVSPQRLRLAAAALSDRYRNAVTPAAAMRSEDERLAYLLVRMPATFAALLKALRAAKRQFMAPSGDVPVSDNGLMSDKGMAIETMLDLGSGPGTAAWAAVEVFPELRQLRLIERDSGLIGLGRQLCARRSGFKRS